MAAALWGSAGDVRQRVWISNRRPEFSREGRGGGKAERTVTRNPRAGGNRERPHWAVRLIDGRSQGARSASAASGARRLRYRLLLAQPSKAFPSERREGGPLVHRRPRQQAEGRGHHESDRRDVPRARPDGGGRGRGDRRATPRAAP